MPECITSDLCHDSATALKDLGEAIPAPVGPIVTAAGSVLEVVCDLTGKKPLIYADLVSPEFCDGVRDIAKRLGPHVDPDWLMACMYFETSGTFAPDICSGGARWGELPEGLRNRLAVGLIQFTQVAVRQLATLPEFAGLSKPKIASLSAVEQLALVYAYLRPYKSILDALESVYCAILSPAHIRSGMDAVMFPAGTNAYQANRLLDRNHDGDITKREATARVRKIYERGVGLRNK